MLTSHNCRDCQQRAGDVQRKPSAINDERIEDDPERFPTTNHAERDQGDEEIH